jgi:hypothetical protein
VCAVRKLERNERNKKGKKKRKKSKQERKLNDLLKTSNNSFEKKLLRIKIKPKKIKQVLPECPAVVAGKGRMMAPHSLHTF